MASNGKQTSIFQDETFPNGPNSRRRRFYVREGDTFKLENGKHKPVQYGFWREKFYIVVVSTKDRKNLMFKDAVFKKFGGEALHKSRRIFVGERM
jgi:hypothetical protein